MKSKESLFAVLVALAVVLAGVAPAVASDEVDSLSISVDQSGESPVVTVTHNASGVANASVSVAATNNSTYTGEGDFTTDANGTVSLPTPAENVTVEIAATKGNASASTTVELIAAEEEVDSLAIAVDQSGDQPVVTVAQNGSAVANASVSVAATNNSTYAGEGEYLTGANGTVSLAAPAENVTVEIAATKGNASASTTVELIADEEPEFENFGERVSWFVHSLLEDEIEGGIGGLVSDFVTSNNPGADNRPDHAGPGGDRGPDGDRDAENETAEGTDHDGPDDHPGKSGAGNGDNTDGNGHGDDQDDDDRDDDHPGGGPPPWAGANDD